MQFLMPREALLKPLQALIGVVEKRQTMPILGNLLFKDVDGKIEITATDLEIELVYSLPISMPTQGEITVSARKLLDICRALPEDAALEFQVNDKGVLVTSGRSRFNLSTLPVSEFPALQGFVPSDEFELPAKTLKTLFEKTAFSMAQQDVRYYLNGLLIELSASSLKAVATDGHRLAMAEQQVETLVVSQTQVIIPRKAVIELQRLLPDGNTNVRVQMSSNHIRVLFEDHCFTSKLIDGRFPDYQRVLPNVAETLTRGDKESFRQALIRTAILANEKYKGVRLNFTQGQLAMQAHNPEHEQADEEISVDYTGPDIEIGFNSAYLLDALNALDSDEFVFSVTDSTSSCLIRDADNEMAGYVVMPMRL